MAKKKQIKMIASMAGDAISYAPDQILTVGEEITESTAIAFCTLPAEEPRAVALDWDPWEGTSQEPEPEPPAVEETVIHPYGSDEFYARWDGTAEAELVADISEWNTGEGTAESPWRPVPNLAMLLQIRAHEEHTRNRESVLRGLDEHIEAAKEDEVPEDEAEKKAEKEAEGETSTSPAAETRETATQPRGRGKRVKPPDEEPPA